MPSNRFQRNILYYPTINIPSRSWLRQALLYWDVVGSIVPSMLLDEKPSCLNREMKYLMDEGEFRPFDPAVVLSGARSAKLYKEFHDLITQDNFDLLRDAVLVTPKPHSRLGNSYVLSRDQFTGDQYELIPGFDMRIHVDKMAYMTRELLLDAGLIRSIPGDNTWYWWEPKIARIYMALLAKHIALADDEFTVVGTNHVAYDNMISMWNPDELLPCWRTKFMGALPVPIDKVSLADILKFKHSRRDELLRFRTVLDEFYVELSRCSSHPEVMQTLTARHEEIETSLNDLSSALRDAKMDFITRLLESTLSIQVPSLVALGVAATSGSTSVPLNIAVGGALVAGTISIVRSVSSVHAQNRTIRQNSPYTYLYHARQQGIIDKFPKRS